MKLKTRLLTPLFAVLMLGTATSAFADLNCTVTVPAPAARDVVNGHWENTGDLVFNCAPSAGALGAAPTTDASVTIYYSGLTIVNNTGLGGAAVPADHKIEIAPGATLPGVIMDVTRTDIGPTGVNNAGSLVAITIPGSAGAAPVGGTFTLRNVLLSLAGGATVGNPVGVNINVVSQSGNTVLTPGSSPAAVIANVLPMLNSTTNPPALQAPIVGQAAAPAQFTSTGATAQATPSCPAGSACANAKSAFSVSVSEDHIDSWRTGQQYYNNAIGATINGTNVLFSFAGMLPGSIISNCVLVMPAGIGGNTFWNLTGSGIAGSAGTTTLVAELTNTFPANPTNLDTLILNCGTSTTNPAYLPGTSGGNATNPITITMSAFPTGTALPGMLGTPATTGGTPRYATGSNVGPLTVIQFGASATGQTTMLIPYALANVGTYDTGIAIANTTKDTVFGTDAQGFAALDTAGSLSFNFYPGDGSASFAITPTTGFNLSSTGTVPAGNSFIGTLSSILKAGNSTAPFQGYIIVVANFTHAHGTAYVYGGGATDRLTSATEVLTISNPLGTSRAVFGALTGVEATGK